MIVRRPTNRELIKCFEIGNKSKPYAVEEFPVCEITCRNSILDLYMNSDVFMVMTIEETIVGWFSASIRKPFHYSPKSALCLSFYQTNLAGIKAVRALMYVHKYLIMRAESKRLEIVMSDSAMPTKKTFNRILEKNGWVERNNSMFKKTKYYKEIA